MPTVTVSPTLDPLPGGGLRTWHFLLRGGHMRDYGADYVDVQGGSPKPQRGMTYSVEGPVRLCNWGLHASENPLHALHYAPGPIVQRCYSYGEIQHGADKLASTHRATLAVGDATNVLYMFAVRCIEQALDRASLQGHKPHPEICAAVAARRAWMAGAVNEDLLDAERNILQLYTQYWDVPVKFRHLERSLLAAAEVLVSSKDVQHIAVEVSWEVQRAEEAVCMPYDAGIGETSRHRVEVVKTEHARLLSNLLIFDAFNSTCNPLT